MGENGLLDKLKNLKTTALTALAGSMLIAPSMKAQADAAIPHANNPDKQIIIKNYYNTPNQFWFNNYAWQFDRFVANQQRLYFRRIQRGAWIEFYLHMNDLPKYNLYFNAQIGIPYYRQNYYYNYYPQTHYNNYNNQPLFKQDIPMKNTPRIIRNNIGRH